MRSQIGFALLVVLNVFSWFFRGVDSKFDLGESVKEGVFFQGDYGMQWTFDTAEEFELARASADEDRASELAWEITG
ncbi:MAG: hypothetical protein VX733_04070 [Candidatus Latescibacterota bacterium]|nr:hypothetical protein [Candidatus Latescibacterota bacterium]